MAGVTTYYQTGVHGSRPANGSGCVLYSCTTHSLVYRDDGTTWTTFLTLPGAGLTDPMTTRGDIIVRDASAAARLAVGAANRVLKSDGTDPAWGQVTEAMQLLADNTTNNASTSNHGYLKKLSNVSTEYMSGTGVFSTPAGGTTHSIVSNALSGAVTMTTANTYYDGPAVTLSAGTWLLLGGVTLDGGGGTALNGTAKLWDGTTVIASGQTILYAGFASDDNGSIFLSGTCVIASGTPTWKISAAAGGGTAPTIRAATEQNAAGNTASFLTAILIG